MTAFAAVIARPFICLSIAHGCTRADLLRSALLFARFLCSRQVGCLYAILVPPYKGGASALLGASGIVFMLIMLSSPAGSRNGGIPLTLILVGALYLSQQVYDILFVQDNIANFMHIVGGACGTVFGFAVRRK